MNSRYFKWLIFVLILPLTLLLWSNKHRLQRHSTQTLQTQAKKPQIEIKPIITGKPRVAIEHWTTSNGVEVYFVATKGLPILDIKVSIDAGSSRDGDKFGLAALCAHLLDKGTFELNADQIAEKVDDLGITYYASIDRDKVVFSVRALTNLDIVDPAVRLFANFLAKPSFPEQNIQITKNQTLMELKRQLQKPDVVAQKAFLEAIYPNHPYGHATLGTLESLPLITKADLVLFQQRYYVTHNTVITLVGNITKEQAQGLSSLIADNLSNGTKAELIPEVPALTSAIEKNISLSLEQAHIILGQPCATENDPDLFALTVGNNTLGGGTLTSRLFKEIRDNRGLVYSVSSVLQEWQRPAPFAIKLQTKNDQAIEAITILKKTLADFIQEGPTPEELDHAKQNIISSFPLELNTNARLASVVSGVAFYKLPLDYLDRYPECVSEVTQLQVKDAFQKRLDLNKMALVVVGAKGP